MAENYLYQLVDLINNYDGTAEIEGKMRDLICFLSENEDCRNDKLYRTVIFEAAEKLRVFGYVKGINRISIDEFSQNGAYDIKQQTIQNYYSSKVFNNNILDKKQKEIVDTFMHLVKKRLLVSAPTSFGKTFILREILFLNQNRYRNILLVFPTIALLNENTESIHNLVDSLNADYTIVNNVYSRVDEKHKQIFILTPERVLKLLSDRQDLAIDFFFFDEVYKIDEDFSVDEDSSAEDNTAHVTRIDSGNRAKAFRITLYLLTKLVNEFYIAGPHLNLNNAKNGLRIFLEKNYITTRQVSFEPTMRIEVEAWKKKSLQKHPILGVQEIPIYDKGNLTTVEKIRGITTYLNENDLDQTIFYCSTPANSMNYVSNIIDSLPQSKDAQKVNTNFIDHLMQKYGVPVGNGAENTAEYWSLIRALNNGYGIHHGKFPKYIQNEVLKMFNRKDFSHLFCTSTIIEGVNTTAKNVVIINNSVGNRTMSAFALKNIKGRAGRYYRHYTGRVFYTDRKQKEIERTHELQLNFQSYDETELLDVDLDNTEIDDLSENNKVKKRDRDSTLDFKFLPDEVFIKNRLYARDTQEKYLAYLLRKDEFAKFSKLVNNSGNIKVFLDNKLINVILESFENCGIIEAKKASVYYAVVSKYSLEGTRGILKYHVDSHIKKEREKAEKNNYQGNSNPLQTIDRAYIRSFEQIRNIVEYEIPKLLCLFEALFSYAGTKNGHDMSGFNMSPIIRFFELGITSELGLSLVEYGFPVDTIQELENKFSAIKSLSTLDSIKLMRDRYREVVAVLDSYELTIFKAAVNSFERKVNRGQNLPS